ncbi:MAG: FCD domain-containing protein [Betaproteobacteria bacterium]|nr:FCD domain-containing protein [Betaproteobacteria bacterium]
MAQYEALIEARVAVEGHAAYLAAIRINEAGLKEFAGANKRLLQATQREDHEGTMQANQEVHFSIYRLRDRRSCCN